MMKNIYFRQDISDLYVNHGVSIFFFQLMKMHGLLEDSYGILGLKCCILIDDTF